MMNTYKSLCLIFALGVALASTAAVPDWCVAKAGASEEELKAFIWKECSASSRMSVDCYGITPGQPCFQPNTTVSHASYVLNLNYMYNGDCDSVVGTIVDKDPSYKGCIYYY